MCEHCGCGNTNYSDHTDHADHTEHVSRTDPADLKNVSVNKPVLEKNIIEANHIREHLAEKKILGVNLMSSPGSGKTSLLEKTAENAKFKFGVLEGDLETEKDADRIRAKGIPAYQITTGQTCHLDAFMVHSGLHHLNCSDLDILFVENVGNLVCPASYDIGMHLNVVLLSVPEGDDKVIKYPVMFRRTSLVLITKIDLAPHFDFSVDQVKADVSKVNPKSKVFETSIHDKKSIQAWIKYIVSMRREMFFSKSKN
jgi:hydrogenase nickel incorporation protein HypB